MRHRVHLSLFHVPQNGTGGRENPWLFAHRPGVEILHIEVMEQLIGSVLRVKMPVGKRGELRGS